MKKTIIALASLLIIAAAHSQAPMGNKASTLPSAESMKGATYSYNIIPGPGNTFGYDILSDKKVTVHQPTIPGVSGNKGFKTKADATKVAELVVNKMKKGEMPPTVTLDEMKRLGVL